MLVTTRLLRGSTAPQLTSGVSKTASNVGSSRWYLAAAEIRSVPNELVRGDAVGRWDVLEPIVDVRRSASGEGDLYSVGVPTLVGVEDVGETEAVEAESERLGRFLSSRSEWLETALWRAEEAPGLNDEVATVGDARVLEDGESCRISFDASAQVRCKITVFVAHCGRSVRCKSSQKRSGLLSSFARSQQTIYDIGSDIKQKRNRIVPTVAYCSAQHLLLKVSGRRLDHQ